MIRSVELSSIDRNNKPRNIAKPEAKKQVAFTGLGEVILQGIQLCEKNPMLNVTFLDCTTAIFPRTFFETFIGSKRKDENGQEQKRKLNLFGGFEAFRRESSGLLINCIIPSFIVIGLAKLLNRPIMGKFNKSNLTKSWANSEALDKIQKYFGAAKGETKQQRVYNTLKAMIDDIEGVDGDISKGGLKKFKDLLAGDKEYEAILQTTAKNIVSEKPDKGYKSKLYKFLVERTGISENIRFAGEEKFSTSNLSHICDSAGDILHGASKENIFDAPKALSQYFKKANKLVNAKSAFGLLGVIIPLAISAQPINRWITHKLSGKGGAPIYNDDKDRHLTPEEKKKLTAQKFLAVPLMWGVAALSMLLDRPSLKMFQFKNIFPTMDQARLISAATFSSRIAASEDTNELKESTIRDIATFSSFYFLGDYAAKAIATLIEKYKGVKLINRLKESDPNANTLQKIWDWAKNTTMKSSEELSAIKDAKLQKQAKNLRALCHAGNIAFSLLSLGIFIPLYTRTQTNKKQKELEEKMALEKATSATFTSNLTKSPAFQAFSLVQNQKAS